VSTVSPRRGSWVRFWFDPDACLARRCSLSSLSILLFSSCADSNLVPLSLAPVVGPCPVKGLSLSSLSSLLFSSPALSCAPGADVDANHKSKLLLSRYTFIHRPTRTRTIANDRTSISKRPTLRLRSLFTIRNRNPCLSNSWCSRVGVGKDPEPVPAGRGSVTLVDGIGSGPKKNCGMG